MKLINGECLEVMKTLLDNSVDAVVSDPPYGLSFMGKKWDYDVPSVDIWAECLRVLKPGGYLLAFAGTRTQHRMAVRIEDAGFEIRDMLVWAYGSGFPKSLNISKILEKKDGLLNNTTETLFNNPNGKRDLSKRSDYGYKYVPQTQKAKEWEGWGSNLKPAVEPITMARKPLEKGLNIAENCLKWKVGGINIDECRIKAGNDYDITRQSRASKQTEIKKTQVPQTKIEHIATENKGRFPANLILDGSDEVVSLFPNTKSGDIKPHHNKSNIYGRNSLLKSKTINSSIATYGDSGSASRFFYCAKSSKEERNRGCEDLEEKIGENGNKLTDQDYRRGDEKPTTSRKNFHPTVKPLSLMQYLVKLVSREKAVVLDPFMGSGTTGMACVNLNREFIGIERELDYFNIATKRIEHSQKQVDINNIKLF